VNTKKEKTPHSGSEEDGEKKKSRAMTAEERNLARAEKYVQGVKDFQSPQTLALIHVVQKCQLQAPTN